MTDDTAKRIALAAAQLRSAGVTDDFMNVDALNPGNISPPRYANLQPKPEKEK